MHGSSTLAHIEFIYSQAMCKCITFYVHLNQINQTLTKVTTCGLENISTYIKNYKGTCHNKCYP